MSKATDSRLRLGWGLHTTAGRLTWLLLLAAFQIAWAHFDLRPIALGLRGTLISLLFESMWIFLPLSIAYIVEWAVLRWEGRGEPGRGSTD